MRTTNLKLLAATFILVLQHTVVSAQEQSASRELTAIGKLFDLVMRTLPPPQPPEPKWKYYAWNASDLALSAGRMTWQEREIFVTGGGGMKDVKLQYIVSLSDLSGEIEDTDLSVHFRCKTAGCITVYGSTKLVTLEPGTDKLLEAEYPVSRRREDENYWYFKTPQVSREAAIRLQRAVRAAGSK